MDLIYTTYNLPVGSNRGPLPPWTRETNSLCSVSCQNLAVFTSVLPDQNRQTGENQLLCVDLNAPWDYSVVCKLPSPATCLVWDGTGTKFAVGDTSGNVSVWKMINYCVSEWEEVYKGSLPHERIIKAGFIASAKIVRLNSDTKSELYNEKFLFGPQGNNAFESEVCVFLTSSGLLTAAMLTQNSSLSSSAATTTTACVGRNRSRINFVDMATSTNGDFLLAACGAETPVTVYKVECAHDSQLGLQVRVTNHSSFCVNDKTGPDIVRISALKFVLSDCSDAITVGVDSEEGGKVRMWELDLAHQTCHKLFSQSQPSPKRKLVPTWRYCSEFGGGGSKLNVLATPRSSIMGGDKPSCYIVVGFAEGTIQCLIRDSLQQIASVELPRVGNLPVDNTKNIAAAVTICDMCFTSTGTGLLVTDSLGQLYLYRMSPIADPGGPHVAPYLVTMYEYCLLSGRDWWDLSLAASQINIQTVADKLEENFKSQPIGVQSFCYYRYMSIKASLYRLCAHSEYRAADTVAMSMLNSIYGDLCAMGSVEGGFLEQSPLERLESVLRTIPGIAQLDIVVAKLTAAGFVKEPPSSSDGIQTLQQLANWVLTLALHVLSAIPEFKTRRGPGFWLVQEGGLNLIRDILLLTRLWGVPKAGFITREKDLDLNAKLYSMICRLKENAEDESLLDECLILPSLVIVPYLDVMVSPLGVLAGLKAGANTPLCFHFGVEPNFCQTPQPAFLEDLHYADDVSCKNIYDSVRKTALGKNPIALKKCNRCRSFTQVSKTTGSILKCWEKRWLRNCSCGGSWKKMKND